MEIKLVLDLPRDAASVPVSRQVLDGCLETLGVTRETRTDIALALSEACANVILHAGPGEEYEVMARATAGRCIIEVLNSGHRARAKPGPVDTDGVTHVAKPAPTTAEHGRGLQIMDAVVDNLRLSGNLGEGTAVHFEKVLDWVPGALGQHLAAAKD